MMESHDCLTYGLCPSCFCIDFDSPDLSYEPRPIADIVASCKIGCTFCGLLTYSLDLKNFIARGGDFSTMGVYLSKHDRIIDADNQNCITAVLYNSRYRAANHATARFDVSIICDQDEASENGKKRTILNMKSTSNTVS